MVKRETVRDRAYEQEIRGTVRALLPALLVLDVPIPVPVEPGRPNPALRLSVNDVLRGEAFAERTRRSPDACAAHELARFATRLRSCFVMCERCQ